MVVKGKRKKDLKKNVKILEEGGWKRGRVEVKGSEDKW